MLTAGVQQPRGHRGWPPGFESLTLAVSDVLLGERFLGISDASTGFVFLLLLFGKTCTLVLRVSTPRNYPKQRQHLFHTINDTL